jgi:type I restriction enzyme R subunit
MALNEAETIARLINPRLYERGWTEAHIRREQSAGAVVLGPDGRPRRWPGRVDLVLNALVGDGAAPVPVALIEAKAEAGPPPCTRRSRRRQAPAPRCDRSRSARAGLYWPC